MAAWRASAAGEGSAGAKQPGSAQWQCAAAGARRSSSARQCGTPQRTWLRAQKAACVACAEAGTGWPQVAQGAAGGAGGAAAAAAAAAAEEDDEEDDDDEDEEDDDCGGGAAAGAAMGAADSE